MYRASVGPCTESSGTTRKKDGEPFLSAPFVSVVFVADSQPERMEANIESIRNLEDNLKEHGFDLQTVPYALQFNKRDLPDVVPVAEMYRTLNYKREPTFEAVATTGVGVFDTLKAVAKLILVELRKR